MPATAPAIPLDLAELRQARQRIAGAILETPLWANEPLSRELGGPLYMKLENLQRTGSFKLRGASYKIDCLLRRNEAKHGVITASAGNHAQGVARAALVAGLPATVVMPLSAPLTKSEACRSPGAEVILHGHSLEEARVEAERLADLRQASFIHPYDDWEIIAGQASVGLEILDALPEMAQIIVPLGGGGLISGIALAVKALRPDIRIIGVQAASVAPWRSFLIDGKERAGVDALPEAVSRGADRRRRYPCQPARGRSPGFRIRPRRCASPPARACMSAAACGSRSTT